MFNPFRAAANLVLTPVRVILFNRFSKLFVVAPGIAAAGAGAFMYGAAGMRDADVNAQTAYDKVTQWSGVVNSRVPVDNPAAFASGDAKAMAKQTLRVAFDGAVEFYSNVAYSGAWGGTKLGGYTHDAYQYARQEGWPKLREWTSAGYRWGVEKYQSYFPAKATDGAKDQGKAGAVEATTQKLVEAKPTDAAPQSGAAVATTPPVPGGVDPGMVRKIEDAGREPPAAGTPGQTPAADAAPEAAAPAPAPEERVLFHDPAARDHLSIRAKTVGMVYSKLDHGNGVGNPHLLGQGTVVGVLAFPKDPLAPNAWGKISFNCGKPMPCTGYLLFNRSGYEMVVRYDEAGLKQGRMVPAPVPPPPSASLSATRPVGGPVTTGAVPAPVR